MGRQSQEISLTKKSVLKRWLFQPFLGYYMLTYIDGVKKFDGPGDFLGHHVRAVVRIFYDFTTKLLSNLKRGQILSLNIYLNH